MIQSHYYYYSEINITHETVSENYVQFFYYY
jgi:hypothetical protein